MRTLFFYTHNLVYIYVMCSHTFYTCDYECILIENVAFSQHPCNIVCILVPQSYHFNTCAAQTSAYVTLCEPHTSTLPLLLLSIAIVTLHKLNSKSHNPHV